MGYMHINNLYKDQRILYFKECWALEKIHGTSAHISWSNGKITFFSGGEKYSNFVELFDEQSLKLAFETLGHPKITVYGEAYGGKQQGQSWRYGKSLKFVVFDVKVGDIWLAVPNAHDVSDKLCLEFVHYSKISTDLADIDAERDAPSEQAKRNGILETVPREGVVLRPISEFSDNYGERVLCKHKRDEERETNKPRNVVSKDKLEVLTEANSIAQEWVTKTRLEHVLDKLGHDIGIERIRDVLSAMIEDVFREGAGELVESKEAKKAISKKTSELFQEKLKEKLYNG